jgi:hypothetical protein
LCEVLNEKFWFGKKSQKFLRGPGKSFCGSFPGRGCRLELVGGT